jgi:hypothetical protein
MHDRRKSTEEFETADLKSARTLLEDLRYVVTAPHQARISDRTCGGTGMASIVPYLIFYLFTEYNAPRHRPSGMLVACIRPRCRDDADRR